jgi:hypothetical protein
MKQIKHLSISFLALFLVLASCSSDDDNNVVEDRQDFTIDRDLVGKWELVSRTTMIDYQVQSTEQINPENGCSSRDYVEFTAPNVYESMTYMMDGDDVCQGTVVNGIWSQNDSALTVTEGGNAYTYRIYRLSESTLNIGNDTRLEDGRLSSEFYTYRLVK